MIYGMDIDIGEDVDIPTFIQRVDAKSWEEFMPKGVTKEKFRQFAKYYDSDIFIEAGRIIRRRVKAMDKLEPLERTKQIAELFGTFKNPDKETVLTPWRVVNMQLGKTIGGYSYFDDEYQYTSQDGVSVNRWIDTDETASVLKPDTKILEINSKTGLYPLYTATSLFYQEQQRINEQTAGSFNGHDEERAWQEILKKNIYVVAKTPMAKTITQRTLAGYRDYATNIAFVDRIVDIVREKIDDGVKKIQEACANMKFDVVIGNPPYQETVAKKDTENGQKRVTNIFQYFQLLADRLSRKDTVLIYPGKRWIHQSGKGMSVFGKEQINDSHLSGLIFFPNANEVFTKGISVSDGISIVLKDQTKTTPGFNYEYIQDGKSQKLYLQNPGDKLMVMNPDDIPIAQQIDQFVKKHSLAFISESPVINQKLFRIESDFVEKNKQLVRLYKDGYILKPDEIKLFANDKAGKTGRTKCYVTNRSLIKNNANLIDEWQVTVSSANAGGQKRDSQLSIADNRSAFGRSRIALKSFVTHEEAKNCLKYCQSYIIRYAFLLTDEALSSLGMEVPDILDYRSENQLIDFSRPIDEQLQRLIGLDDDTMKYVVAQVENLR